MASNQWRRKLQISWPGVASPKQGLGLCSSLFNISISMLLSFETHHPLTHIESSLLCSVGQPCSMLAGFPLAATKQKNTFQPASGHSAHRTRLLGTRNPWMSNSEQDVPSSPPAASLYGHISTVLHHLLMYALSILFLLVCALWRPLNVALNIEEHLEKNIYLLSCSSSWNNSCWY